MTFKNTAMVFAGLAIAVGTLTTKVMESNAATKEKVVVAQEVWYEIDSYTTDPHTIVLDGNPVTTAPSGGDCNLVNTGTPCAMKLSFPNNDAPFPVDLGATVQDLIDNYGAEIILDGSGGATYARKL